MTGEPRALVVATAGMAMMGAIAVSVIMNDSPAKSAAVNAARPASPQPSAQVRKPVEMAPPVGETVPRDGTWIIGKEIKRGTYRTAGSSICLWQRLGGVVNGRWSIIDGAFNTGPQTVALGKDDVAFASQGCPVWELVR